MLINLYIAIRDQYVWKISAQLDHGSNIDYNI